MTLRIFAEFGRARVWLLTFGFMGRGTAWAAELPRVLDERLAMQCFAEAPDIVTPTGVAVDAVGAVYVVESHTHFRPDDYAGPQEDRIKRFVDHDGDGRADEVTVFYEGGRATMNLALDADGTFFVATRSEVFTLRDTDTDGRADQRTTLARLETDGDYPHNGLSGFAFDGRGNVYFGLGENLGASYRLAAQDGSSCAGGGEGGSIFRMTTDGNRLERFATGFWNPFHLCFDAFGRLFAVDNDPDSRPPCRLLHIVEGGDYGYRFRNGRRGRHPFTAWFGGLPGTLGLMAETGEAPSGILAYESDQLPDEYVGVLLGTSWGNHALQAFTPEARGATFRAQGRSVVEGDENFRPVAIALAPDGSLMISDWVDRSYNLHGKGRVWRLARRAAPYLTAHRQPDIASAHQPVREAALRRLAADGAKMRLASLAAEDPRARVRAAAWRQLSLAPPSGLQPASVLSAERSPDVVALALESLPLDASDVAPFAAASHAPLVRAAALRRLDPTTHSKLLLSALDDDDPFIRQAAAQRLARLDVQALRTLATAETSTRQREELAVMERAKGAAPEPAYLRQLLDDPAPRLRFVALQWIGEAHLAGFEQELEERLAQGAFEGELLDACLAALSLLRGEAPADYEQRSEELLGALLARSALSPALLAHILRRLPAQHAALRDRWPGLLHHENAVVRLESVRSLRAADVAEQQQWLRELAAAEQEDEALRAEALAGLAHRDDASREVLLTFATRGTPILQRQALRSLRGAVLTSSASESLLPLAEQAPLRAYVQRALGMPRDDTRPAKEDTSAWLALFQEGDAREGERIFFHPEGPRCYACHLRGGRGGEVGPDLSGAGQMELARLFDSLAHPSREIAPQFVTWGLEMKDGRVLTGTLVTEKGDEQTYANERGESFVVQRDEVEHRQPLANSLMPDNLLDEMTIDEVRDVMAYLRSAQ